MPAPTPLTSAGRMSSAHPGSMPDTKTELLPAVHAGTTSSSSSCGALAGCNKGKNAVETTFTPARKHAVRSLSASSGRVSPVAV